MQELTLKDLQRIAIAKHGEDAAWAKALFYGNPRHKATWQQVINTPARTPEQQLDHQLWQQEIRKKFGF